VHFHVIPRYAESGLGIGWKPGKLDGAAGAALAAKIAAGLRG
jgi:diadenosine tetraphosphate (Ap4A) HIT family hydrolase